jgi:predicted metal-dependent peptidase
MFTEEKYPGEEFEGMLSKAKVYASLASTMLSYCLFNCTIKPTRDPELNTAGATIINGENVIYLNIDFFKKQENDNKRGFILLHEVLHIFLEHGHRRVVKQYHAELFNIACDYNINLTCSGAYSDKNGNIAFCPRYTKYLSIPEGGCYDERFLDMSSDEIYGILLDEADGDPDEACKAHGGGDGDVIDVMGESVEGQMKKNAQTALSGIIHAQVTKTMGVGEGNMTKLFQKMSKPKINWSEHVAGSLERKAEDTPTYNRISRRSGESIVFPTYTGTYVKLIFGIDSSGSMSEDDISRGISELYGIVMQYDVWEVHFITCDIEAHVMGIYKSEEGDAFEDFNFNLKGFGGTDMQPIFDYSITDEEDQFDACICITDGYIPPIERFNEEIENIVVVVEGGNQKLKLTDEAEVFFVE